MGSVLSQKRTIHCPFFDAVIRMGCDNGLTMKKKSTLAIEQANDDAFERDVLDHMAHSTHDNNREIAEREVAKAWQSGKKFIVDGKEIEFA
jgi:hypothetical protein